jgi:NADH dehydrogenase FAD-containing subunit
MHVQRLAVRGSSSSTEDSYDVVIVGGGLVGSTLACLLGKTISNKPAAFFFLIL